MRLILSIAGKVIVSVPLDQERWNSIDYIQAKRRLLTSVHASTILLHAEQPVFYIEVASRMNNPDRKKILKNQRKILQESR